MDAESSQTDKTEEQWDERVPARPRIHYASPTDRDQKRRRRGHEYKSTNVVDLGYLFRHGALSRREVEEGDYTNESDDHDGNIEVENPTPCALLGKHSADEWTCVG